MSKRTERDLDRRCFLGLSAGGVVAATLPLVGGCSKTKTEAPGADAATVVLPHDPNVVRIASVPTAVEGDVPPTLAADFEKASGLRVTISAGPDIYDRARRGEADLVVSHYGHRDAETFVLDGFGEWPRTIFSNQMALIGPTSDPARIRGLDDAGEAFRRIAEKRCPFILNDIDGVRYLTEILWNVAGRPDRAGWLIDDQKHRKVDAMALAAERGGYVLWGLTPFLRNQKTESLGLEPLVLDDPLLHRMLVSIVVRGKVSGVNADGASRLQAHLLAPATQAKIRSIHYPGIAAATWVPGGRHNRSGMLPKG